MKYFHFDLMTSIIMLVVFLILWIVLPNIFTLSPTENILISLMTAFGIAYSYKAWKFKWGK